MIKPASFTNQEFREHIKKMVTWMRQREPECCPYCGNVLPLNKQQKGDLNDDPDDNNKPRLV